MTTKKAETETRRTDPLATLRGSGRRWRVQAKAGVYRAFMAGPDGRTVSLASGEHLSAAGAIQDLAGQFRWMTSLAADAARPYPGVLPVISLCAEARRPATRAPAVVTPTAAPPRATRDDEPTERIRLPLKREETAHERTSP